MGWSGSAKQNKQKSASRVLLLPYLTDLVILEEKLLKLVQWSSKLRKKLISKEFSFFLNTLIHISPSVWDVGATKLKPMRSDL